MGNYTGMKFNPETGLENRTAYETRPASESRAREILSDMSFQLQTYLNGTLLPQMEEEYSFLRSAGAAASLGANGTQISAGYPNTVQGVLQQLYNNMKEISQGAVADGSVTLQKMAPNVLTTTNIALSTTLAAVLGTTVENALSAVKLAKWFGYVWDAHSSQEIGGEVVSDYVFTATIENNPGNAMASDFTVTIPSGVTKVCVEVSGFVGGSGWSSGTITAYLNGTSICGISHSQTSSYVFETGYAYVSVTGGDKITLRGSSPEQGGAQGPRLRVEVIA